MFVCVTDKQPIQGVHILFKGIYVAQIMAIFFSYFELCKAVS